uniref:Putative transglycosylase n=1 Tax=viral metagenome TaxID=1070528 RepID=A0A6M3JXP6_9ZZZZ
MSNLSKKIILWFLTSLSLIGMPLSVLNTSDKILNEAKGALYSVETQSLYVTNKWNQLQEKTKEDNIKELYEVVSAIKEQQPKLDKNIALLIGIQVLSNAKKEKVDPALIVALIMRESSFNALSESEKDCYGLMQIRPKVHPKKVIGLKYADFFSLDNNIRIGTIILKEYLDKYGSVEKALKRYVGGTHPEYVTDILINFTNIKLSKYKGD